MNHSSKIIHGSLSGFRKSADAQRSSSSDRTKRDIGAADDLYGQVAPELPDGLLLIGRYRILRRLGRGGFSDVYLAHDHELDRSVAIKRLLLSDVDQSFIKEEAKTLASLDHPGIVKIYDTCNDPMHGYLVIMQYVPGPMLRDVLTKPISINRAVEVAIRISGGLIHAHSRGVVHRDIKPTNILMSNDGEPLIADFGLAFTPRNHCEPEGGTPRYMSPEQIRNETKRIGPSSDIFSTGILLYEMLAGRVPFNGSTAEAISRATLEESPTPINEINADVPLELDRIVRRALRKNVKDRYNSMEAFQAELIQWLNNSETSDDLSTVRIAEWERSKSLDSTFASSTLGSLGQFTHRGLQPFESDDAKFFLSLVPGTRAPSGLPESVQYWKDWIESYDGSEYGRMGILYGPSGSGKTSLLRAGIVPYLAPDVLPINIECRKGESISWFSLQIGQQVSCEATDLAVLLLQLRDNPVSRNEHRKVVLLFDQFDNWAGSASNAQLAGLAAALRHCDGESLQALLIVRDNFWTAATEFMKLVECGVEQWKNALAIELFDRHHARRLLEAAGRSFGSLPPSPEALSVDQARFIKQAIDEMSIKGRVLPIQLAMFAKMAKLQSWHPDTLSQAGGVQGTYVGYFQDLFESPTSPPAYQRVSSAVVEVLHCLLPNADQTSHSHQVEFGELEAILVNKKLQNQLHRALNILVEDLRIVVRDSQRVSESSTEYAVQCNDRFHLVHDFLTVPISNWVDQVRMSTWRGRAIARLEELSAMWNRKQHPRFLPTLPEFVAMQIATRPQNRSPEHRRFLQKAGRKQLLRAIIAFVILAPISAVAVSSIRQHQQNVADHEKHVYEKLEMAICGGIEEFIELLRQVDGVDSGNRHNDRAIMAKAPRPWEQSTNDINRIRTHLLFAKIEKSGLDNVVADIGKIEPQLSKSFMEISRQHEDAAALLNELTDDIQQPDPFTVEQVRAAISLAYLGNRDPLVQMLDDSQSPAQVNLFLSHALHWDVDPSLWFELAKSERSGNLTYCSLFLLCSYPDADLQSSLPWVDLLDLQNSADAGVSMTAKWLFKKKLVPSERLAKSRSPHYRELDSGLEQIRIEAGCINQRITTVDGEPYMAKITIDKPFWLSSAAVTNREFEVFLKSLDSKDKVDLKLIDLSSKRDEPFEKHPDRSVTGLNPILIAKYCNWLSDRAKLTRAYEILPATSKPSDCNRIRIVENANGFRLPSVSQIAFAADYGLVDRSLDSQAVPKAKTKGATTDEKTAELSVKAFYKSRGEEFDQPEPGRFEIKRFSRSPVPNRVGVQFDFDAYYCWAVDRGQICSIGLTQDSFLVHAREEEMSNPYAALWLVSDCDDDAP